MHHEPIYEGITRPNEAKAGQPPPVVTLIEAHDMICEFLMWIDPQLSLALSFVNRFEQVHDDEWDHIRARIKREFNVP
jgi:hypothetical protein